MKIRLNKKPDFVVVLFILLIIVGCNCAGGSGGHGGQGYGGFC
ncbi:sporulation protein YjcZ [Peribacillus frigoritolerans]|uniref:Sporulation protein YjcZ n=1 Tax=Peribacillus castrilensis TaxID=2897690 RepID=A0AAW9NC54_9BACI|nr:sporulation protein YjcZ [Peribacillus castrilensis]